MKKMDGRVSVAEGRALRINCAIRLRGVKDLEHAESTHSSQKKA